MQIAQKAVRHSRAITCILLLGTSLAHAQEPMVVDTVRTYRLSGVLVTATRGSGEALSIPMAVGIVSLKDFQLSRRFNLEDALSLMPGVFAQSRAGGQDTCVTIRGFGARGSGDRSEAGITLDVTLHHVGAYAADDANAYTIPSSTIIGSSASYEFKIGALSVRGFAGVSNAAGSQYAASAFINPVGAAFLEPGLPRNYFGGLDVNLGL